MNKLKGFHEFTIENFLEEEIEDLNLDKNTLRNRFNFDLIPGGKNNYRSSQITPRIFPQIIKKYGIKNIIRLNGDGSDSFHKVGDPVTYRFQEEKICKDNGCIYYFIDPSEGYQEGKGYTKSIEKISKILSGGNTLIHCAHGKDRTGGMVGGYLLKSGIMEDKDKIWEYTIGYNSWPDKIKRGAFFGYWYDKYADCFYPISELKLSKWVEPIG